MKKAQDNNPSTEIRPLSNSGSIMSYIKDQSFLYNPEKLDWRNRLIYTLFSWASLDTSLDIVQFCMEYKMHRRTLYKWLSLIHISEPTRLLSISYAVFCL